MAKKRSTPKPAPKPVIQGVPLDGITCPTCGKPAVKLLSVLGYHMLACGHNMPIPPAPAPVPVPAPAPAPTDSPESEAIKKSLSHLEFLQTTPNFECPTCSDKWATTIEERILDRSIANGRFQASLACGHQIAVAIFKVESVEPAKPAPERAVSEPVRIDPPEPEPIPEIPRDDRWVNLRPYQQDGVRFLEDHNYSALIGDEMGLGKTIQAIYALRGHKELFPLLVVVPANLCWKWARELKAWLFDHPDHKDQFPILVQQSDGRFIADCPIHILPMSRLTSGKMAEGIKRYGFKTVIVDEAHNYKEDKSARTKVLLQGISTIPHRIALTGTAVMNRPQEYFNILHMVSPRKWPSRSWLNYFVKTSPNGRAIGLDELKRDQFFQVTADHVIRRKKVDVAKDLPEMTVDYGFVPITGNRESVLAYNKAVDELEAVIEQKGDPQQASNVLAILTRIRHLLGLTKVPMLIEQGIAFLEQAEPGDKFAIGTYHQLVNEFVCKGINEWIAANPDSGWKPVLSITNEAPLIKDGILKQFKDDPACGILAASIRGAGVGLDIQFCSDVVIGERDWNRAIEAQFEGRFHRIGSNRPVSIEYLMAENTLDQFFHELVMLKGKMTESFLEANADIDSGFAMELARRVTSSRLKYAGF